MALARARLIAAFEERGHQLWLVGGAVRDDLIGIEPDDEDFATDARPDIVEELGISLGASVVTVGQKYGTVGINTEGGWVEVTTFRGESYSDGTRWPEVSFGADIDEDLARRDFTVNAIAQRASGGDLYDPFDGRRDIEARLIRAVGEPAPRFREDPLRILRGLRLASQLDFEIDPATQEGMALTVELLRSLSQERVTAELTRMLVGAAPLRGLHVLEAIGGLAIVLPELAEMPGCEQNSFHEFDVWLHTVATVKEIEVGEDPEVRALRRWAALLHDVGKPVVRHRKDNGEWGFYRHDSVGGDIVRDMLSRLKLGKQRSAAIELLVRRHMDRPDVDEPRSVRRFMRKTGGYWRELVALKRADNASHTYDDSQYHDRLETACERVETEDAEALRAESPLNGRELMTMFERPPGRWIADVKERLSAMVLDGDLAPGDKEAAAELARSLVAELAGGSTFRVRDQ